MLYPIPYIAICAILGVLAILIHQHPDDKDYCRKLTMAGMVACVVFLGFRGFVFHDWYIYYPEFEKLSFYDIQKYEIGAKREIGWLCFQWICKSIFDNYHFMIFVHSVITLSLLYRFLNRYTQNILLGIIIYLIFDGFTSICIAIIYFPPFRILLLSFSFYQYSFQHKEWQQKR